MKILDLEYLSLIIVFAILLTSVRINRRLLHDGRPTIERGGRGIPPASPASDHVGNLVLVLELALLELVLEPVPGKLVVLGAALGRGRRRRRQRVHLAHVPAIVSVVVVLRSTVAVIPAAAARRGVCGLVVLLLLLLLMLLLLLLLLLLVLVVSVLVSHEILLDLRSFRGWDGGARVGRPRRAFRVQETLLDDVTHEDCDEDENEDGEAGDEDRESSCK